MMLYENPLFIFIAFTLPNQAMQIEKKLLIRAIVRMSTEQTPNDADIETDLVYNILKVNNLTLG